METEQDNGKEEEVQPNTVSDFHHKGFSQTEHQISMCATICTSVLRHTKKTCLVFITLQNKMQTDQDEQQSQGDGPKEAEEKTPRENEEMEVR